MNLRIALLSAAALGMLAACGGKSDTAQTTIPTTPDAMAAQTPDAAEAQAFINAAGQASLAEIETSKMAVTKAKNADLKTFAQTMIDDHTAAGAQLATIAAGSGLAPPAQTLDDFHMRRVNDLTETDGDADFDADYAALQVDAHKDAIKVFEDYIKDGDVPALKSFAEQTLPKLKEHQAHADTLNQEVRGKTPS